MLEAWSRAVTVKMDISGFEMHITVLDLTEFDDKYIMKGKRIPIDPTVGLCLVFLRL